MAQPLPPETSQHEPAPTPASRADRLRAFAPVALTMVAALALRLWGIHWGLPNQERYLSYHPDEGVNLVQGVMDRGTLRPHLDLGFYNYGALYFYLWQGAVAMNRVYSLAALPEHGGAPSPDSAAAVILVGRLMTVALGTLTVWAVFALANRLYGRRAGLLAGVLWAIAPAAVTHGHYATVDVPATFFVTLTLVWAANALKGTQTVTRDLLLSGSLAGLAAATKYNAAIVLAAPTAVFFLRARAGKRLPPWILPAIIGVSALGFLIGCPGPIINPARFWDNFAFELRKSGQGMDLLFADSGNGWWYHLASSLRFGLGLPLLAISLGGLALALKRRTSQDLLLLAFLVPYYLVIGYAQVRFLRYILPVVPVLAAFSARLLAEEWKTGAARTTVRVLGAAALAVTLLLTLSLDRMFTQPDTRDLAKDFIEKLPKGTSVAFVWIPWFQSPPLLPDFTLPTPRARQQAALGYTEKRLLVPSAGNWDSSLLGPPPDAFAVSEFETEDAERLRWPPAQPFFRLWHDRYTPHIFDKTPSIFGIDFGKPVHTPVDWLYPNPRTTVYTLEPPQIHLSHEPRDRELRQPSGR